MNRILSQEYRIKKLLHRTNRLLLVPLLILHSIFFILSAKSALAAAGDFKLTLPSDKIIGTNLGNYGRLILLIINLIFAFIAATAFIGIVYSGVMMITSGGDATKFAAGKKNLIWSIIGIIVITLAFFIIRFVGALTGELIK